MILERKLHPHGNIQEVWRARDRVLLVEGAAGTGKTYGILGKFYVAAIKYDGCRLAIVRQTRSSMTQTVLATLENKILPPHIRMHVTRQEYRIGNSVIVVAGLDNPLKVLSAEYDAIYVNEGTETSRDAIETLMTRLRNGVMPYHQFIIDANPTFPQHWLNIMANTDKMRRIKTTHKDNPIYWHAGTQQYTPAGIEYRETLASLTGARRRRFFEGVWEADDGLVLDTWLDDYDFKEVPEGNVQDKADYIPDGGTVVWAVDQGYQGERTPEGYAFYTGDSHPRVFLLIQERGDGTLCVFDESHNIMTLLETHINEVLAKDYPKPRWAAIDSASVELKLQLNKKGIPTKNKPPKVEPSLEVLRKAISPDKNGVRRLLVHPRCKLFRAQAASYSYDEHGKIKKAYDDTIDSIRYYTWQKRFKL